MVAKWLGVENQRVAVISVTVRVVLVSSFLAREMRLVMRYWCGVVWKASLFPWRIHTRMELTGPDPMVSVAAIRACRLYLRCVRSGAVIMR